jgi:hypothetical protein
MASLCAMTTTGETGVGAAPFVNLCLNRVGDTIVSIMNVYQHRGM